MKPIMKTSVTILKELLVRYEHWVKSGGVRASTAGPLSWEHDEVQECVTFIDKNDLCLTPCPAPRSVQITATNSLGNSTLCVFAPPSTSAKANIHSRGSYLATIRLHSTRHCDPLLRRCLQHCECFFRRRTTASTHSRSPASMHLRLGYQPPCLFLF